MIVGIDTITSGGHRGTGGGGGEEGVDSGAGRILKYAQNVMYGGRYGSVRSSGGGEVYVCARVGMHVQISIYCLSIAYRVSCCDVSPLLQEQGTDIVTATIGCTVQCSLASLQ